MAAKRLFKPKTKAQYEGYMLQDKVVLTKEREGIIHYIGKRKDKAGVWFGIAISNKKKGKHNGTVGDVTYFKCKTNRGIFVKSKQILHNKREIKRQVSSRTKPKTKTKSRSKHKRTESSPMDSKTKPKLKNRKRKTKHAKMISVPDFSELEKAAQMAVHELHGSNHHSNGKNVSPTIPRKAFDLSEVLQPIPDVHHGTQDTHSDDWEINQMSTETIAKPSTKAHKKKKATSKETHQMNGNEKKTKEIESDADHIESNLDNECKSLTETVIEAEESHDEPKPIVEMKETNVETVGKPSPKARKKKKVKQIILEHTQSNGEDKKSIEIDTTIEHVESSESMEEIEAKTHKKKKHKKTEPKRPESPVASVGDKALNVDDKKSVEPGAVCSHTNDKQRMEIDMIIEAKPIETKKRKAKKVKTKEINDVTQSTKKRKSIPKIAKRNKSRKEVDKQEKTPRVRKRRKSKLAARINAFNAASSGDVTMNSSPKRKKKRKKKIGKLKKTASETFHKEEVRNPIVAMTKATRRISDASHGSSNSIASSLNSLDSDDECKECHDAQHKIDEEVKANTSKKNVNSDIDAVQDVVSDVDDDDGQPLEIRVHPLFIQDKNECCLCGENVESEGCCFIRWADSDPHKSKAKLKKIKQMYIHSLYNATKTNDWV